MGADMASILYDGGQLHASDFGPLLLLLSSMILWFVIQKYNKLFYGFRVVIVVI
jgi:hypothetical protein